MKKNNNYATFHGKFASCEKEVKRRESFFFRPTCTQPKLNGTVDSSMRHKEKKTRTAVNRTKSYEISSHTMPQNNNYLMSFQHFFFRNITHVNCMNFTVFMQFQVGGAAASSSSSSSLLQYMY